MIALTVARWTVTMSTITAATRGSIHTGEDWNRNTREWAVIGITTVGELKRERESFFVFVTVSKRDIDLNI